MSINSNVIKKIQFLTEKIKKENDLSSIETIRDDVFNILQNLPDCTVVYYPLEEEAHEDGCDGCHVVRTIKGREQQFVFINSANTRERQAFSIAHELGHLILHKTSFDGKFAEENDAEEKDYIHDQLDLSQKQYLENYKTFLSNLDS